MFDFCLEISPSCGFVCRSFFLGGLLEIRGGKYEGRVGDGSAYAAAWWE